MGNIEMKSDVSSSFRHIVSTYAIGESNRAISAISAKNILLRYRKIGRVIYDPSINQTIVQIHQVQYGVSSREREKA